MAFIDRGQLGNSQKEVTLLIPKQIPFILLLLWGFFLFLLLFCCSRLLLRILCYHLPCNSLCAKRETKRAPFIGVCFLLTRGLVAQLLPNIKKWQVFTRTDVISSVMTVLQPRKPITIPVMIAMNTLQVSLEQSGAEQAIKTLGILS